jgi:hypothetical protein
MLIMPGYTRRLADVVSLPLGPSVVTDVSN